MLGFGDDGDDGEDVDAAEGGEIGAAEEGGADCDERGASVGMFGGFEGHGFDAGYGFGRVEGVAGRFVSWDGEWLGMLEVFLRVDDRVGLAI